MPRMATPLLHLQDIHLTLGGAVGAAPLLDGAEIAVSAGDRIGLVGRNGSGKSTLLSIAAGTVRADTGTRFLQPGTTMQVLAQEPDISGHACVLDWVAAGLDDAAESRARGILYQLGLTGEEKPGDLSGGETRRAALARALAPRPDLLLLDEPTNHLDLPAIEWLEKELGSLRTGIVVISHDRRLLQRLTRSTVWLDRGRTRRLEQGFSAFEEWRDAELAREESERHKLDRQIQREEDWMRYGVTARRKRNVRRVAQLADLRRTRRDEVRATGTATMVASRAETSGKQVVVAEDVTKRFGERTIVGGLSLKILRGDRLGIVGPNGAGKTTLLKLLLGELAPDEGSVRQGTNLTVATLDQRRAALDPDRTLADTLTGGGGDFVQVNGERKHVVGYMKDFLFRPEQARTPVGRLSGGERGRVALACALAMPANLLVLDEPTNDLDLETLDLLQEVLADHPGTVLVVSHDRDFLDRVATSTLAAEGDGLWVEYAGGYADMLAQRGTGSGSGTVTEAIKPTKGAGKPRGTSAPKLSGKDRHLLTTLPGTIASLQTEARRLERLLADPKLYAKDPKTFARHTESLAANQAALAEAEDRWLSLEVQREALEA